MKLKSLKIRGFRNLKPIKLVFDDSKQVFAFVGPNAQGKTNFLESIYLTALSKSFKTKHNIELINFDEDYLSIEVEIEDQILEVVCTRTPVQKALKLNGVKKTAIEFVGKLKAVFFSPEDLSNMAYAPKLRRRYLDVLISQLNREYLENLVYFNEAKKRRNSLLKSIREGKSKEDELLFWDEKLVRHGEVVNAERKKWIQKLSPLANKHYQAIAQSKNTLKISYKSVLVDLNEVSDYKVILFQSKERDIQTAKTQRGPHRDDLEFSLDEKNMESYASRGEWRSMVLALKFSEIELIEKETGRKPVLLLDDVFSELDTTRQAYLVHALKETQAFISTTHEEFIEILKANSQIFKVQNGSIINESRNFPENEIV